MVAEGFISILSIGIFCFLVCIIAISTWHKLSQPKRFEKILADYNLVSNERYLRFLAVLLPGLEVLLLFAVVIFALLNTMWLSGLLLFTLLASYTLLLVYSKKRNLNIADCGCSFNTSALKPSTNGLVFRNSFLLIACVILMVANADITQAELWSWVEGAIFSGFILIIYSAMELLIGNQAALNKMRVYHD